ncbi:hypothetical protein ABW20_dc0110183 [Dactylellina cionopaga]|nr:hypothetical protein ABW20_dc0110183 [Dactylellina cionopaga]
MLFNKISVLSVLAFAATSFAATCVPTKSCSAIPKATSSSCASIISAKKLKYSTCTVWKTVVPQKVVKTIVVNQAKATVVKDQAVTATVDETGTVSVFSTATEYTTTVFLEEASVTLTDTEVLSFTETETATSTDIIYNYGFALRKRASAKLVRPYQVNAVRAPCYLACLLTKTTTKTVTALPQTTYTTKTLPRETITLASTSTATVTVLTLVTTVVVESTTSIESQYSTYTVTVPETTQTSTTATLTITATVQETSYTCVDPNRARCGNYCYRIQIDWYNCGGCGQRCSNGQVCSGGRCIS